MGNGVDEHYFDPDADPQAGARTRAGFGWGADDFVVGTVGRVVREKGFLEYFDMAGRLARSVPSARFLIVGLFEPEQSDAVDPFALARAHGIEDRCQITQGRGDLPALYAAMDVFVMPSHREGLSKSLLEATAMARPTVACDIRGCREVVIDGDTGLLAPVRDAVALTESVSVLQRDEVRRRRMGVAGRQRLLGLYTESGVAQRVLDVYGALASLPTRH